MSGYSFFVDYIHHLLRGRRELEGAIDIALCPELNNSSYYLLVEYRGVQFKVADLNQTLYEPLAPILVDSILEKVIQINADIAFEKVLLNEEISN